MGDTDRAAMLELELCDWHLSQQRDLSFSNVKMEPCRWYDAAMSKVKTIGKWVATKVSMRSEVLGHHHCQSHTEHFDYVAGYELTPNFQNTFPEIE